MKKDRSLKQSLTTKFLLLATLPIVIVGLFSLQNITSSLEAEIGNKNFLLAKSLASEVERFLNEPVNLINQIEVILFTKKIPSKTHIRHYLDAIMSSYPFFERITILNPKGRIAHLSPFNRDLLGSDMSNQDYFDSTPENETTKIQFSSAFISERSGQPTLTLSKRVNNWIIVGHLNLSALEQISDKITIGKRGYGAIADKDGTVLAHKNRRLVRERFNVSGLEIFKRARAGEEGTFRYRFAGEEKIGSVTSLRPVSWLIIVSQPLDEAFRPIQRIRNIILTGVFISLLAAIVFAVFSLKRTLNPLIKLTTNAEKIADGQYEFESPSHSYHEINQLAEKFRLMAHGLEVREKKLSESEENYRDLVQSSNSIILKFDLNFSILFTNKYAQDFFGFTNEELVGKSALETIIPRVDSSGTDLNKMAKNLINNPDSFVDNENENIRKNGDRVWIAWRNKAIYDNNGQYSSLLSMGYDVTDRKRAEKSLQDAHNELEKRIETRTNELKRAKEDAEKANQLKSEFLANISHELRTPMHHILSYSKFGDEKTNKVSLEKLRYYFSQIRISGGRLLLLLNDLLDLSKLESGAINYEMVEKDMLLLVENLTSTFSTQLKEKSIKLAIVKPDHSAIVVCDEAKIDQVLNNLLANAIKFTPHGQSITFSFHTEGVPGAKKITDKQTVPALVIRISDSGIGIPENELESIFDKFVQSSKTNTGAGGTGLGLSICREIINAHNGKIWAENNPDNGATFSFKLPYEKEGG